MEPLSEPMICQTLWNIPASAEGSAPTMVVMQRIRIGMTRAIPAMM